MTQAEIEAYCRTELDRLVPRSLVWPAWTDKERAIIIDLMGAAFCHGRLAAADEIEEEITHALRT